MLKNAGVSDVVAREIVGHDSPAMSNLYTHIETATLRVSCEVNGYRPPVKSISLRRPGQVKGKRLEAVS